MCESLEKVDQDGLIALKVLEKASFKELGNYLTLHRDEEFPHIIHFDGHGLIGRGCKSCKKVYPGVEQEMCCGAKLDGPEGYLLFEDDEDTSKANYISAKNLARKLDLANCSEKGNEQPGVVLIVLSACQSGVSLGADTVFNGVAQSLIRVRIPAVVGMQFSVSVDGAARFTDKFYQSLNQCDTLLEALTRSREEMGFDENQWYRPVLYLRSSDVKGGKIFTNLPGPRPNGKGKKASHAILDSAFQFHAEMLEKQSELSTISSWFDAGNVVGNARCTYTIKFLNTIREVIQKYSGVLKGAASSESGDDLVEFRYSLITPLDASVEQLKNLAKLLPAFTNSNTPTRRSMMQQEEISNAMHELAGNIKKVHIHIALYEALLNVNPTKLKALYMKLGVSYKDILADPYEMKISNLIEYCKRNNKYEELIQEVLVEHPDGLNN